MKSDMLKKLLAMMLGGMFLFSTGAFAADKYGCKEGEHWDEATAQCVKDKQ